MPGAVAVFRAFRLGTLRQVALTREALIRDCPECVRLGWRITASTEDVPEAEGVVHDWSRNGCGGLHAHWICPLCGQEHWSDFEFRLSNPALWLCEQGGGEVCLVHWRHEDDGPAKGP